MIPDIKTQWVEALRSGKYAQGQSLLRNREDKFCCLGVLCDILEPRLWVADFIAGHEGKNQSYTHHGMRGSPERQLLASVGLIEADTEVLIVMNDEEDKSFGEIADYIEKSL